MRARDFVTRHRTLPVGWALASLVLVLDAVLAALSARDHMQALGRMCGDASAPHCAGCIAAVSFVAMAVLTLAQAIRLSNATGSTKVTLASY